MLDTNQIENIFTDGCSVTIPAENYLYIRRRMKELERERDYYKSEYQKIKEQTEVK